MTEIMHGAASRVVKNPQINNTDLNYCEEQRILQFWHCQVDFLPATDWQESTLRLHRSETLLHSWNVVLLTAEDTVASHPSFVYRPIERPLQELLAIKDLATLLLFGRSLLPAYVTIADC